MKNNKIVLPITPSIRRKREEESNSKGETPSKKCKEEEEPGISKEEVLFMKEEKAGRPKESPGRLKSYSYQIMGIREASTIMEPFKRDFKQEKECYFATATLS